MTAAEASLETLPSAWYERALERGLIPDFLLRAVIRGLCRQRLREEEASTDASLSALVEEMRRSPVALECDAANRQHYEVSPDFFRLVLGPRRKYSCCYWPRGVTSLAEAEDSALAQVIERAGIRDGQQILDLGCGWGSLSLYLAERFPSASIIGVSNSRSQKQYIEQEAAWLGLRNLTIITADMNSFESPSARFDRIVSIEMFEHMRNWDALLTRIASWSAPDGKLFLHVFAHRRFAYPFVSRGDSDWMARQFFTGGLMPSVDLLASFQKEWTIAAQWTLNGQNYQRTSEAWIENLERNREKAIAVLAKSHGIEQARRMCMRWQVFFLACSEMFGYRAGTEWVVAHYLLTKEKRAA